MPLENHDFIRKKVYLFLLVDRNDPYFWSLLVENMNSNKTGILYLSNTRYKNLERKQ